MNQLKSGTPPVEAIEAEMLSMPQAKVPIEHRFAPGIYIREMFAPKGSTILGHKHRFEHMNVCLAGRAVVSATDQDEAFVVEAPLWITSKAGVRKLFYVLEDLRWATIHPTKETDIKVLEEMLVDHSQTYRDFSRLGEQLNELLETIGEK